MSDHAPYGGSDAAADQIWMLRRGQRDPMVWPFDSEEDAEEFRVDHALIDWKPFRIDNPEKDHEPVCANDREPWPCRHKRLDHETQRILAAARSRCHRCGKQTGWMRVEFPGGGELGEDIVYHGKLGACFNEAKKRAAETQNEKALADIKRCTAQREYARDLRRRSQERRAHA